MRNGGRAAGEVFNTSGGAGGRLENHLQSALRSSTNIKGSRRSNRSTNFKLATTGPAPPLARLRPPPIRQSHGC
jgi:hypothetical protein